MRTSRQRSVSRFFVLGAVLQGIVLGALLSVAVVELWTTGSDVQLFQYQKY